MKTIYIVLTRSTTFLSRMVHLFTADTYTHVSISFEEELQPLYSSSRKNGRTMFPAGPCMESFQLGWFRKSWKIPCAVYELQVSEEAYEQAIHEVEQIMKNADEYHYNIIGLIFCRLNIPLRRRRHFFCSQFVSEVLKRSNALDLPKDTTLMKPGDYMRMPELFCCFTGYMSELIQKAAS